MSRPSPSKPKAVAAETSLGEKNLVFYDVRQNPFQLYGLYDSRGQSSFKRMPDEVAQATNPGVARLYRNTSGGRVRFSTDSPYVAVKAVMPEVTYFSHMQLTGTGGFDLYIDDPAGSVYHNTFFPPFGMKEGYEAIVRFGDSSERQLTVHFPLYSHVDTLLIGLDASGSLSGGRSYRHQKPVLYYGSSITQGGCASRPGNSYPAVISRRLDCDFINLGFSGSARGEDAIVEYLSGLDASVFVCDYDHNAPSVEHLEATHEKLFLRMRESSPELPVVFVTKPDYDAAPRENALRRDVVCRTYMNAVRRGDQNVWFVDGRGLFLGENRDSCTVDSCHPNDLGHIRMAEVIGRAVAEALASSSSR